MKYTFINNESNKNIANFIKTHPQTNIFQTFEIFEVYKRTKNYEPIFVAVEDDNGEIVGVLLGVTQKEHTGFLGRFSTRAIIWGGPLIKDDNPVALGILLKEYNRKIKRKAIYSQFRNLREFSKSEKLSFQESGYIYEPHLDIIHNLCKPIDEQWAGLHSGRRKNIRRAERAGVIFREIRGEVEFEKAYQLVRDTYNRIKLPMPDKSLFLESYRTLTDNDIFKVFIALHDDIIIASRMVLCYNSLIYDWYAGADERHLDKYPNDFLPWKVIEWGSLNGYNYFDFGGAGKPGVPYGVRDHKLKFGGQLVEFGRFEKLHNKWLMNIGKMGFFIYKIIKS